MDDSAPAGVEAPGEPAGEGPPAAPEPARRPRALSVAVFAAALLAGTLAHFAALHAFARDRVLPGVTALGANLGGLEGRALEDRIAGVAPRVASFAGKVQLQGRVFGVSAEEVGLALDVGETARRARGVGRDGSWFARFRWFLAHAFSKDEIRVAVAFDTTKLEARLVAMEREALGEPAVEGAVAYAGRVVATYPRAGLAVPRSDVVALLTRALVTTAGLVVPLPVRESVPKLSRAGVDEGAKRAAQLVEPITLSSPGGEAKLAFSTEDLGRALRSRIAAPARLDVFLDRDALREPLAKARAALEKPPRDATFSVNAKREVSVVPSELGTRLDEDAILESVMRLASGPDRAGELAFKTDVVPALTTEQAEALRVRALVAEYTTPFPCCEARVKNIERMAALVNGSIVRPGESYSLNQRSGPRTAGNGFVAGPTIVEGEMELTVGGGVSQFATTLFNAVFDGGYEIIQRQAHTFWFPRYPEGYDATLGFPLPDLVFRNDTDAAIFIKTEVGKAHVKVELYGDNGGRRVQRQVSPRFDLVKPETLFEPNPELRPDEEKVKFGGWTGWSLHVSRVLTFPDGQKKEERRKVIYSPRARRVEVHPCKIPEGQPGHTGERCPKIEVLDGGVAAALRE